MIPDAVGTWNTYNQILHAVKDTHDKHLMDEVENIIKLSLQNPHFQKGEVNNEQNR